MKRLLISIIPILFSGLCFSQTDIDLTYSSFFGGTSSENAAGIIRFENMNGNYAVFGSTLSDNLPTTPDAFQPELEDAGGGFYSVFSNDGSVIFASYLSGTGTDNIRAGAVSDNNQTILAGRTFSPDFPLVNPMNVDFAGTQMGFITKFDQDFNVLWSTYFGGGGADNINALSTSSDGAIFITGNTSSENLGTTGVHQVEPITNTNTNSYLAKLNSSGEVIWYTYISGSGLTLAEDLALSSDGSMVYVTGISFDADDHGFINAHQPEQGGNGDCFLAAYSAADGDLLWGTYYGGNGSESEGDVGVMENGTVILTGGTSSEENIATENAFQAELSGNSDNFIAAFDPEGNRLWATYYGGPDDELGQSDLEISGNAIYMMGTTLSNNGISLGNPYLDEIPETDEDSDGFLVKFDQEGQPVWATFLNQNYECALTLRFTFGENQEILAVGNFNPSSNQQACLDYISPDAYQPFYGGGDSDVGIFIYQDNTLSTIFPQAEPLNIYPNPASDFITIEIPELLWAGMELTVTDLSGRLVDQVRRFQSGNSYETSHLSNGIYILTGRVGGRVFREKLVVSH